MDDGRVQLLVGWITVLDSVPEIDILQFLPEYLGGLFDMLSDPMKGVLSISLTPSSVLTVGPYLRGISGLWCVADIRQQAYAALAEFLKEITQSVTVDLGPMVMILVSQCESTDNFTRLTALTWMFEFIQLGTRISLFALGVCLLCCAVLCCDVLCSVLCCDVLCSVLVVNCVRVFSFPPVTATPMPILPP